MNGDFKVFREWIAEGRGVLIDREPNYRHKGFHGPRYTGGTYMTDRHGNKVKGRKIENNTYAYVDDTYLGDGKREETIVIRLHDNDIVRYWTDGVREVLSHHDSQTTRSRFKDHLDGFQVSSHGTEGMFLWGVGKLHNLSHDLLQAFGDAEQYIRRSVVFPFCRGFLTTLGDIWFTGRVACENGKVSVGDLLVGIRAGDEAASDALASFFRYYGKHDEKRGDAWDSMRSTVLDWRGKPFGPHKRKYKKAWGAFTEGPPKSPHLQGLWLCDHETGTLERALTRRDELFNSIDLSREQRSICVDGKVWDLVDGFSYSAK